MSDVPRGGAPWEITDMQPEVVAKMIKESEDAREFEQQVLEMVLMD